MKPGGVLVVCETGPDQSEGFTPDLLAASQQVAAATTGLTALVVGGLAGERAASVADHVDEAIVVEQAGPGAYAPDRYLVAALRVVAQARPHLVLFGHTPFGIDLAPRLAARLGAPYLSNVLDAGLTDDGGAWCTRPLVDMGWLGPEHQVGLSGRTVHPSPYVACGISGAPEHLAGMRGAETIVAVNTDPAAPIFELATYGIVGDVAEVLPELTRALRSSARGAQPAGRGAR